MTYKLEQNGDITRTTDGARIPPDPGNRDYAEYLEWVGRGNEPIPLVQSSQISSDMVRAEGARRLALIGSPYSKEERETWPRQVEEAKAFAADENAETTLLAGLADARGITVAQMAAVVTVKANAFAAAARDILAAQARLLAMDPIPADYADASRWP